MAAITRLSSRRIERLACLATCVTLSRDQSAVALTRAASGFFLFVVVGSSLLQIIKTATSGLPGMPPPPR
jgi:hypothetical protein